MFAYALAIAVGVLGLGHLVNERVEVVVWQSLLNREIDLLVESRKQNPDARVPTSGNLHGYVVARDGAGDAGLAPQLQRLEPGLHDELSIGDRAFAVMVRDVDRHRIYMMMDITALEAEEQSMTTWLILASIVLTAVLALLGWWISARLLRPLSAFTAEIDLLSPTLRGRRVTFSAADGSEIVAIGSAVNNLLERIEGFVQREREFINTTSHELRTPIAAIIGAAELTQAHPDLTDGLRRPLGRIQRASREIDQLIHVLLVLAKSPERIMEAAGEFTLEELVEDVVNDHRPLTTAKALSIATGMLTHSRVKAPMRIAQIAIANLVRNAIEHSDNGKIDVAIEPAGVVRVTDPGHGMAAAEIGRLYAALARQTDSQPSRGIGLELMARICEHLDWVLQLDEVEGGGTIATLDVRVSLVKA